MLAWTLLAASLAFADDPTAAILKDRAETQEWLKSKPTSYLAAVRRKDFGKKATLTVGAADGNDVPLEGLEPRHLSVTVEGDKFKVAAVDAPAGFRVKNGDAALREATLDPGPIAVGRYTLRLSHQGYPAIIVFDPRSPRFNEYKGIPYYPVDLRYRFVLPFLPDPKAERVKIASTHSADRAATRRGWFEFAVDGKPCRLAAYRLEEPGAGPDGLSLFFRDATTGKETYKVGRYVEPEKQPDGRYVVDFNMAYSPACAYSPHYNCPIPPKENRLKVAIRAGEKNPKYR
ncbi:MAG: DUF1684 domain-containing protein [Elusimicrobia bacterium]|nr:DUF1684 domain-containing protein [Elusimicrobiota bacterium]